MCGFDETANPSTRLPKDGNQVAGYDEAPLFNRYLYQEGGNECTLN